MSELRSDATDNLLGSLIIAGHFMIAEVCLFFNNRLFRGNRCGQPFGFEIQLTNLLEQRRSRPMTLMPLILLTIHLWAK
jgi:hypothetical protein